MEHGIEIKPCWWLKDLLKDPETGFGFAVEIDLDEGFDTEYFFGYSPTENTWEKVYSGWMFFSEEEMNDHIVRHKEFIISECERKIKEYTEKLNSLK